MDILLINVHSSCNAGDAALTLVALEQLRVQFSQSRFTLAMDDPSSHSGDGRAVHSFFGWVRRGSRWRVGNLAWLVPASIVPILTYRLFGKALFVLTPLDLRATVQAYIQADMVVSKPGGFLYSSGRGVTFAVSIYTMLAAWLAGKPLYMCPQSIGPLTRSWERVLLKWTLERVRIVMVREPVSLGELQALGLSDQRCHLLPDLAFGFPGAPAPSAKEWLQAQGIRSDGDKPLLGMTVIRWGAQNPRFTRQTEYEAACARAARFFIEQYDGQVVLFPQVWGPSVSQDDRVAARRVAGYLHDLNRSVFMIEDPISPDLLKAVYGLTDLFVGTRMHSNIFCLSEGVPVIAIGYQPKTRGIIQMVGLERWMIDIERVSGQALIGLLEALWDERDHVRDHLRRTIPLLVQQGRQAGAMIAADYAALHARSRCAGCP